MLIMNETTIIKLYKRKPKLKNGVLITGLPGIGLIGRIAVEYLIEKLKGKKIAELYSPSFPPHAIMGADGKLIPLTSDFYLARTKKYDIVLMIGDIQALDTFGQYEMAGKVGEFAKELNVKEIITIGGYATGKLDGKRSVYGVVNNFGKIEDYKKVGVEFGKAQGAIVGFAGLLPIIANLYSIPAICLLGTTYGSFADPAAAEEVLKVLTKKLSIKIDLSGLHEKAKENEKLIKKLKKEIEKTLKSSEKELSYIR